MEVEDNQQKTPFFTYTLPLVLAQEKMNYSDDFIEKNFDKIPYNKRKNPEDIINFLEESKKPKNYLQVPNKMDIEESKVDAEIKIVSEEDEWDYSDISSSYNDSDFIVITSLKSSQNPDFTFYYQNNKIEIKFRQKEEIIFDLKKPYVKENPLLLQTIQKLSQLEEPFGLKNSLKIPEIEKVTPSQQLTLLEYFLHHHNKLFQQAEIGGPPPEQEKCPICYCELYDFSEISSFSKIQDQLLQNTPTFDCLKLKNCSEHFLHTECFLNYLKHCPNPQHIQCPTCQKDYGIKTGNMPPGKMSSKKIPTSLPGFENCQTIQITYNFPSGQHIHINNNVPYQGTARTAYLPDNEEGNKVLALLRTAFERRLTFVVGQSVTTGLTNQVVWAGIHHKTSLSGGTFGYPDPTYLQRVQEELKDRGVF
ncbi:hypothetical protein PPERSA_02620 [Pseudocohnilembus persalinus]|uniref:RING-type E3 ubiquitin transferase n=1 Tax=Pseudocohnilembus persalinus TaxID=266149 RepID=A0A0V0R5H6_PSEPJ|nr:hypothetical protein PPERSA_02620 [Pseudocohnilembus persalinus]|eukprot:KRX09748.1 hypothetical protein PPERSA_02620 [Pseudocohnilembus persalinus]